MLEEHEGWEYIPAANISYNRTSDERSVNVKALYKQYFKEDTDDLYKKRA